MVSTTAMRVSLRAATGQLSASKARLPYYLAWGSTHRQYVKPAYNLVKKVMPKISATEAAALRAGTIGFDRDLFGGNPSLKELQNKYTVELRSDERAFMENEVNHVLL